MLVGSLFTGCAAPAYNDNPSTPAGTRVDGGDRRTQPVHVVSQPAGRVGHRLDEHDRLNMSRVTERVIATNAAHETTSPTSGVRVRVTPQGPSTYEHALRMQVMVSPAVNTSYPLRADRRIVFAETDMDLRAAPRLASKTTYVFRRGERAEVVAFLPDSQYRLISINGTAVGYARDVYLAERKDDVAQVRGAPVKAAPGKTTRNTGSSKGAGRPKQIALRGECKILTRAIYWPNGAAETESVKFCKEPPSTWKQVAGN
jgi:hypothetical protein